MEESVRVFGGGGGYLGNGDGTGLCVQSHHIRKGTADINADQCAHSVYVLLLILYP